MNRRAFATGLGALLAAPLGTEAQQTAKMYRSAYWLLADSSSSTCAPQSFGASQRRCNRAAGGLPAALAAKRATDAIPIIFEGWGGRLRLGSSRR